MTPIVLFVYNRPQHTLKTLKHLRENIGADESTLYIYSDGAKENSDQNELNNVAEVRKLIRSNQWCKEVIIIESDKNKGLARSIIDGVTQIVNKHGSVIVLEDDLITSKGFLKYMNTALKMYEADEKVISISGYVYPVPQKLPETFFMRGADCLGWGTWKRGWQLFEKDPKRLLTELQERNLSYEFEFSGNYPYMKMLEKQLSGQMYSWAILWHASAFLKNKLTLCPNLSLLYHIGIHGTNYNVDPFLDNIRITEEVNVIRIPIVESGEALKIITTYFSDRKKYLERKDTKSLFQKIILRFFKK